MKDLNFTQAMVNDYYEKKFHSDLSNYFVIEKNEEGNDVVTSIREPSYAVAAAASIVTPHGIQKTDNYHPYIFRSSADNQFLFIAFTSFMLSAEEVFMWETPDTDTSKLYECLNAFGFPILRTATQRFGLVYMLDVCRITNEIWAKEEVETLRDAMLLVEPFMFDKLKAHLMTWNNGFFADLVYSNRDINETILDGLRYLYDKYYKGHGLTGIELTNRDIKDYYSHHFYDQFRRYFSCYRHEGTYLLVSCVTSIPNKRWADMLPGNNTQENLMFAAIMLYMTIAEQCILENVPSAHKDFHKCFGWPMIYSGPGAGPYLHPLKMLEYADLSLKKYESPLFLEVVKIAFNYLRQEMNALLNGRKSVIKDQEARERFLEAIEGHTKGRIRKYLDFQEKSIQDLLTKWTTSPEDSLHSLLVSEGIPIQMEIKQ